MTLDLWGDATEYARKQHKYFVDNMYSSFGLEESAYFDKIEFRNIIPKARIGLSSKGTTIYLKGRYTNFENNTEFEDFGKLDLDISIFHESSHLLHYKYHQKESIKKYEEDCGDTFVLEALMDLSVYSFIKNQELVNHQEYFRDNDEKQYGDGTLPLLEKDLTQLLITSEDEALSIITNSLGESHPYLVRRIEDLEEGNKEEN